MKEFVISILNAQTFKVLLVLTCLDVFFGIMRAGKNKSWNSTVGIDGLIRKTGMIVSAFLIGIIDKIVEINFIGFLPKDFLEVMPLKSIGVSSLFCILYIIFEALSVLKNMYKCGIPIPRKLDRLLKKILKEFTSEIKEEK